MSTNPHPDVYSSRATLVVWVLGGLSCWVVVLCLVAALV